MDAALTFEVGVYGEFLSTRSKARAVRASFEKQVRYLRPDSKAVIDFAGVGAMTIGFADEFLGNFYTSLAAGDVTAAVTILSGLNDETRETISVCLERRNTVAAVAGEGGIRLVAAPDFLDETYRHAGTLKTFRAGELSELLGITSTNMNNRLKRLVAAGALRRERNTPGGGGKEFTYTFPHAENVANIDY